MALIPEFLRRSIDLAFSGLGFTQEPNLRTNGGSSFRISTEEIEKLREQVEGGADLDVESLLRKVLTDGTPFLDAGGSALVITANPSASSTVQHQLEAKNLTKE